MPFTPSSPPTSHPFLGRSGPTKPLSHERMLEVAYAYRRLWQAYRHNLPLTDILSHDYLEIEAEIARWEAKSAKLRYEARRQASYRAAKKEGRDGGGRYAHYAPDEDLFVGQPDPQEIDPLSDLPDATKEALRRYREQHGAGDAPPPDTSGYKRSGLV